MKGYQITFFTQQDRKHKSMALAEWLIHLAKELGLRGATLVNATEGFGHSGKIHSAHFFELADQPQAVIMTATEQQATSLFARLALSLLGGLVLLALLGQVLEDEGGELKARVDGTALATGFAVESDVVVLLGFHDGFGILAFLAKKELGNEAVKVVLELIGFVSTVDDPAVVAGVGVCLSSKLKTKVFDDVCEVLAR